MPAKKPARGTRCGKISAQSWPENGDAEEDDVAGHGVGKDVAVVEVDDGVEQAAGGGEQHGIGECGGLV